jgi:hypothetical protein
LTAAVALVTARAARSLDEDLAPLGAALAALGVHAEVTEWSDCGVDWQRFDAAVLRSAWDYHERLPEFLAWLERTARVTRLLNPLPVVRWSLDKHYLGELARAGAPVVPTTYGAGSRDARRHARARHEEILAHMQRLLAARRSLMLQPYLETVDHSGETALMYIDGRFSHAIRKGALLPSGAPSTAGLFAPEEIIARAASPQELAAGERVLAAVPFGTLLYARVDLLRDAEDAPRLLELELAEPSLYFGHAPGSAQRFAAALVERLTVASDGA